jgi:fumarate hydratase subunit beta
MKRIRAPLEDVLLKELRAGEQVLVDGVVYVARDAAHKRMADALDKGEALPFDPRGQIIYYMGPSPTRPGKPIGSAGPTTSGRMDAYTPALLRAGLKGMIGKGSRSREVRDALRQYVAVYLVTTGGAGALIAQTVRRADVVAYEDLGAEALLRMDVDGLPAIVGNDIYGGDVYQEGKKRYHLPSA